MDLSGQEARGSSISDRLAATVSVEIEEGRLSVQVRDDGVGFDQASDQPGRLGLRTMTERADMIGAELSVASAAGAGTTVTVSLEVIEPELATASQASVQADADPAAHRPRHARRLSDFSRHGPVRVRVVRRR